MPFDSSILREFGGCIVYERMYSVGGGRGVYGAYVRKSGEKQK